MSSSLWINIAGPIIGVSMNKYFSYFPSRSASNIDVKYTHAAVASQATLESLRKEFERENPHIAFRRRMNPLGLYWK